MGVLVRRPVRVRVIVTDEFKAARTAEIRSALARLESVGKRIEFELSSVSRRSEQSPGEITAATERLRAGHRNNQKAVEALGAELRRLSSLSAGDEYDRGMLDGMAEVEVGDDFSKLAPCVIVVKDGKIIEVREGAWPETDETSS